MGSSSKTAREDAAAVPNGRVRTAGRLEVEEYQGHRVLVADGVIFSVEVTKADPPFGYWTAMLPSGIPCTALLLGLGAGTLAHLLSRRFPGIRITGVDNDPEILAFARNHFDLDLPNLKVKLADAFDFVTRCKRRFDFVAVDLFVGSTFERGVLSHPFLHRLGAIRSDNGEIVFNLYRDRHARADLAKIHRVLPVRRVDRLAHNVIVHCWPTPSPRDIPAADDLPGTSFDGACSSTSPSKTPQGRSLTERCPRATRTTGERIRHPTTQTA